MDTSKEFILMCEKAGEIQKKWSQHWIDMSARKIDYSVVDRYPDERREDDDIWLPRQDQLQGMVLLVSLEFTIRLRGDGWVMDIKGWETMSKKKEDTVYGLSIEQLWLAFVMSELYQKYWNGTDWRKK